MMIINTDLVYPIGSIYISVNATNPSRYFGGTWVAWGAGRVPVGVDSAQTEFSTVEKTGGSKYLQAHTHTTSGSNVGGTKSAVFASGSSAYAPTGSVTSVKINSTGQGDSENLQPYITCYMWKRTA